MEINMENKIVYFEKTGKENTDATLQLVKESLKTHPNIKKIVLASTTGVSAKKAVELFKDTDIKLVIIPHQYDFSSKTNRFTKELADEIRSYGHEVHYGTMLFHTNKLFDSNIPTIIADFLRCFSQGYKVCYEIVLMAADAGLVESGEQVIAIAGTGLGSDTALIMQAASTQNLSKLRINEIICKPLNSISTDN
jgi:hypothetical protein